MMRRLRGLKNILIVVIPVTPSAGYILAPHGYTQLYDIVSSCNERDDSN
ncbi:MAG: hypothetical protein M1526_06945 [Candidatus Thermoplasmatota archaeon]|nr:hypothetical protein [Candidatus Thermoplasmatota archaeon]MCL5680441.1 hypothetical protein [Candidatus Thermoplasmatota archaeon]